MELTNASGDKVLIMEQTLKEAEEYGIRHLSFVNGTYTRLGGNHVNYNANKIGKTLAEAFGENLKQNDAAKFFIYIVNYTIKGKVAMERPDKVSHSHIRQLDLNVLTSKRRILQSANGGICGMRSLCLCRRPNKP